MLTRTVPPEPSRPSSGTLAFVLAMFAVVTIGALYVPFFNRVEPSLYGVPFFYWFQMSWIFAGAGATALAYRLKV